jgi:hypothetical protein
MSSHEDDASDSGLITEYGMSLRDHMAAAALPQAVEDYGSPNVKGRKDTYGHRVIPFATTTSSSRESIIARQAYKYADAMLIAREN